LCPVGEGRKSHGAGIAPVGYILTPIHPCISVSVEYFRTSMGLFLRRLIAPAAIGLVACLGIGLLLFRL